MATTDTSLPLEDGGWVGEIDSLIPEARRPGFYQTAINAYPVDGTGLVGRPGIRPIGARLGTPFTNITQCIYQFTRRDGAEFTITIVQGRFFTLNWVTEVWTEVLTAANLTGAGITINAAVLTIQILTYLDGAVIVVNDGVNTPWAWDGTAGAGLTLMNNAPVFSAGSMTVYNGRLLGIKASDPVTFVWSETDVLNTGYEAGGFNNSWTFTQSDSNRLYALVATNDGVYVLRARSAAEIGGSVTQNWSTGGSRDDLSLTEGSPFPFSILLHGSNLFLVDADVKPQLLRPGGAATVPIWLPFRETLKGLVHTAGTRCISVYFSPASLILVAVTFVGIATPTFLLVFDAKNGQTPVPVGTWGWNGAFHVAAMGMVKSGAAANLGDKVLMMGGENGDICIMGSVETGPFDDTYPPVGSGLSAIFHTFESQALGVDTRHEKIFDRIDLSSRCLTTMTLAVRAETPSGLAPSQTVVASSGHSAVGIDARGRWAKVRIDHGAVGERFALSALTVQAYVADDDPAAP